MNVWNDLIEAYKKRVEIPRHLRVASLAQWILESGRGTSGLAKAHLNFGGIKMRKELAPVAIGINYKAHDGKDEYAKFKTVDDFITGFWLFIGRKPYEGWEKNSDTSLDFVRFIHRAGYAEAANYVNQVSQLFAEADKLLGVEKAPDQGSPSAEPTPGEAQNEEAGEAGPNEGTEKETPEIDEILSPVVVLLVGHEKKAGGANLNHSAFKNEYAYNTKTAEMAKEYAAEKFPNMKVHIIFRDGVGRSGALAKARDLKPDATIELHFNAANAKAIGTETLCSVEQKDRELAEIVQRKVCLVFGRGGMSRGVKAIPRGARGGENVYLMPGYANCLIEPFFGDTKTEADMAVAKHKQYACALVEAMMEWCKKVSLA
jgi:hypothetical protein